MSKLTLRGDALKRAAERLGIPAAEEQKQPSITPEEARRRRRAAINALWARLAETYPAAIAPRNHTPLHPLKIGIDQDIRERCPDVPLKTRDGFLRRYVGQPSYQRLLTKLGAVRVDLDGDEAGAVSEDQAQQAAEKLSARAAGNKPRDGASHD